MKIIALALICLSQVAHGNNIKEKLGPQNNLEFEVSIIEASTEKFHKPLQSGLSNIFISNLIVGKGNQIILKVENIFRIYFDLWDEVFIVNHTEDNKNNVQKIKDVNRVLNRLFNQTFSTSLKYNDFNGQEIWAEFHLIHDPITKEKQKKIIKWLAQNQVNLPSQPTLKPANTPHISRLTTGIKNKGLVGKILESEFKSDLASGAWIFKTGKQHLLIGGQK